MEELKLTMKLIPNWNEKKYKCSICGANKSVKYHYEGFDGYGKITIPCCNKCALIHGNIKRK